MRKFIFALIGLSIFLAPLVSRADGIILIHEKDKDAVVRDRELGIRDNSLTVTKDKDGETVVQNKDYVFSVSKDKDGATVIREKDYIFTVSKDKDGATVVREMGVVKENGTIGIRETLGIREANREYGIKDKDAGTDAEAVESIN